MSCFFFFFFSSRRRHTRSLCDWSSDVCSSDLTRVTSRVMFYWRGSWSNARSYRLRGARRSEEHTSELQSHSDLVCRLLLEKKKKKTQKSHAEKLTKRTA